MVTKISAKFESLTHDLAVRISTMQPVPGERDKKPGRLNFFKRHLKNGTFGSPTWSIAVVKNTGEEFRADGQHTSFVLAALPPDQFPQGLSATVQYFQIDSVDNDAATLFDNFDNPASSRTNTDAMSLFRARYDEIHGLSNQLLVKVATGIDYYLSDLPLDPDHPAIRFVRRQFGAYYRTPEYRAFALWMHEWEGTRHAWMTGKGELVAEMLHDWKAFPQIATVFWGHVLKEDHPDAADETRELAASLKDLATKKKLKPDTFRKQARKIWDRYRKMLAAASSQDNDHPLPPASPTIPNIAIPPTVGPSFEARP